MPAKKRSFRDAQDSRERLLQAAIVAFADLGYDGVSVRDIADRAGVGFQLIGYHFGSKDQLWLAAVQDAYEYFASYGQRMRLDPAGDLDAQFREYLRQVLKRANEHPHLLRILIQEGMAGSARYTKILKPMLKKFYETVTLPYFRDAERLGVIRKATAAESDLLVGSVLVTNLVHSFHVEFFLGKRAGSDAYIERQVDLLARLLQ